MNFYPPGAPQWPFPPAVFGKADPEAQGAADGAAAAEELEGKLGGLVDTAAGTGGGGGMDPTAMVQGIVEAANAAKDSWFSMFSEQRWSQADPCYKRAFLEEVKGRWISGSRLDDLRRLAARLNSEAEAAMWRAGAWRDAEAEALRGIIKPRVWLCPDFSAGPDGRSQRQALRNKLPNRGAASFNKPSSSKVTTSCATPKSVRRYLLIGPDIYYDRLHQKIQGPGLRDVYRIAEGEVPLSQLAPSRGPLMAAANAVLSAQEEYRDRLLGELDDLEVACNEQRTAQRTAPRAEPEEVAPRKQSMREKKEEVRERVQDVRRARRARRAKLMAERKARPQEGGTPQGGTSMYANSVFYVVVTGNGQASFGSAAHLRRRLRNAEVAQAPSRRAPPSSIAPRSPWMMPQPSGALSVPVSGDGGFMLVETAPCCGSSPYGLAKRSPGFMPGNCWGNTMGFGGTAAPIFGCPGCGGTCGGCSCGGSCDGTCGG